MDERNDIFKNLPSNAVGYINLVIKNMRYRKKVRQEVREELIDHFEEFLKDVPDNQKEEKAQELISQFGDAKILAKLMRRAKKRCRPLWQKIFVRSSITAAIIFGYLIICAIRLNIGTPVIKTNYAQWLTDRQRQSRDESLNAKPEIDNAIEAIHDVNELVKVYDILRSWPTDLNDAEKTAISNFLHDGNQAFDNIRIALQKPYFWTDYNSFGPMIIESNSVFMENPKFISNLMEPLITYRQITYGLGSRINWRAYTGDIEGAVDDLTTVIKFSSYFQGETLVEQLVSVAIKSFAYNKTIQLLWHADLSAAQLKRLQDELSSSFPNEFPFDLTGEKAFWYSHIEMGFTDDGQGNGRILRSGVIYVVRDWKDSIWCFLTFSYPDKKQAIAKVERTFDEIQRNLQITPWQKQDKSLLNPPPQTSLMLKMLFSDFDKIAFMGWRLKTQQQAAPTIIAVLRYKKEKERYPDTLNELVNIGYLAELPQDPFGPGPLTYKKTQDGFLLYSWGENLKDDNGEVPLNEKGKPKQFADEGDWVFWPVSK